MSRAIGGKRLGVAPGLLALAVSVATLFSPPATAELLVTRDGQVIETKGPWKVQGKLVTFRLPGGQLASLQLAEVDLEASQAAWERARAVVEEPPAPKPPQKKAVLVLTDADVRRAPPGAGDTEAAATGTAGEAARPAGAERLTVASWEEISGPDGVVIVGEFENSSSDVATNIGLAVLFYDGEGELLRTAQADVTARALRPGQRAGFRADVTGLFDYAELAFEAESLGFEFGDESEGSGREVDTESEAPEQEVGADAETSAPEAGA